MNGNRGGWVPIQRTLLGSDIWLLPDGQRIVYVTLQLLANHAAKTWTWRGQEYSVQPGQLVTSSERLAAAAGVTRQTVRSALKNLAQLGALINESTKSGVLITLTSWGLCQSGGGKATNQRINQQMAKTQPRDQPTDQPTKKTHNPYQSGFVPIWRWKNNQQNNQQFNQATVENQPTVQPLTIIVIRILIYIKNLTTTVTSPTRTGKFGTGPAWTRSRRCLPIDRPLPDHLNPPPASRPLTAMSGPAFRLAGRHWPPGTENARRRNWPPKRNSPHACEDSPEHPGQQPRGQKAPWGKE